MYILPGNPEVTDSTLPKWHEFAIKEDPNVSKAVGKKAKMERMKAGRCSCVVECPDKATNEVGLYYRSSQVWW